MPKNYVGEVKLSPAQMTKIEKGQSCTVCKSDLMKDENELYQISFQKLKDLNRYKRAMISGKGFRISPQRMNVMKHVVEGGAVNSNSMAPLGGSMLPLGGKGVSEKRARKSGGKLNILKAVNKIGYNSTKLPSDIIESAKKLGSGMKRGRKPKNPVEILEKKIETIVPNVEIPDNKVADMVEKQMKPRVRLGGNIGMVGLGGSNSAFFTNNDEKMAYVRSHRMVKGGSMRPL